MSNNTKTSAVSRNLALNAAFDVLNSGKLKIYSTPQPTDADTALGAQVLLASLAFGVTAFAAAASGSKTANAITDDADADAGGTAAWGTLTKSDDTRVTDFTVGTSGCDLNLNTVTIVQHADVAVTSLVASQAA